MSGIDLARYPNLWKRGSRYYVRVRVPTDLRLVEKREHIAVSLGTGDQREAVRRYRDVHGKIGLQFEAIRAELAGRDAITKALNDGRLEALSDVQVETLVRGWFDAREHLRKPPLGPGDEEERLRLLREDRARLDEMDPAAADVARNSADRLLADAGAPLIRRRIGGPRPAVDRTGRQYRYLLELVDRALRAENALAQQFVLRRPVAEVDPMFDPDAAPTVANGSQRKTVSELIEEYRADRERAHGQESTDRKYSHIFRALKEALGPDKPVREIGRADCRAVRDFLRAVPKNATKHYPDQSLAEASVAGARDGRPCLAPTTVASYMNNLSALLNWAVQEEWIERNPAKGLMEKGQPQVRRRGFSPSELKTLFAALAQFRETRPDRFWVPALALFSGARTGELCQLQTTDVIQVEGVWCIDLSEFDAEGRRVGDKALKTKSSERIVPIHPQLIAAGFRDYVTACAQAGQRRLFPALVAGSKGSYSHEFSKWFGRFRKTIGFDQPSLVHHSFRHGFRDACRMADIPEETARALGGWAAANQAARYGDRGMVPVLNRAVRKLKFGDFRLSEFGVGKG